MGDLFTFEEERPCPDHFHVLFKSKCMTIDAWPLVQDVMLNQLLYDLAIIIVYTGLSQLCWQLRAKKGE